MNTSGVPFQLGQFSGAVSATAVIAAATGGAGAGGGAANGAKVGGEALDVVSVAGKTSSSAVELSSWPANDGFLGDAVETVLKAGTRVDRYGADGGRYVAPQGTPLAYRSLRAGSERTGLSVFEVLEDLTVQGGMTAPAFGQPGLGIQYRLPESVSRLLAAGSIKRI